MIRQGAAIDRSSRSSSTTAGSHIRADRLDTALGGSVSTGFQRALHACRSATRRMELVDRRSVCPRRFVSRLPLAARSGAAQHLSAVSVRQRDDSADTVAYSMTPCRASCGVHRCGAPSGRRASVPQRRSNTDVSAQSCPTTARPRPPTKPAQRQLDRGGCRARRARQRHDRADRRGATVRREGRDAFGGQEAGAELQGARCRRADDADDGHPHRAVRTGANRQQQSR